MLPRCPCVTDKVLQNPHASLVLGCTCTCICACIAMIRSDQIRVGLGLNFDVLEKPKLLYRIHTVLYACMYANLKWGGEKQTGR